MIRRPPRSTQSRSSAASDVYKRQMLEGSGFEVIDMGTDVSPDRVVKGVIEHKANVIGMSALLTTTMPSMGTTIQALQEAGVREHVKVMIGGAPVTDEYAKRIGADGYSPDASSAVRLAKSLCGGVASAGPPFLEIS